MKLSKDIPEFKFNTSISAMMIFVNLVEKHTLTQGTYETFLQLLAPFAPHLCEELWEAAGKTTSIHLESFPVADQELAHDTEVTIGVQVNGKMRGSITLAPDASEADAMAAVQADQKLTEKIVGDTKKIIYIPGKIINIIVVG